MGGLLMTKYFQVPTIKHGYTVYRVEDSIEDLDAFKERLLNAGNGEDGREDFCDLMNDFTEEEGFIIDSMEEDFEGLKPLSEEEYDYIKEDLE
jgi:hypothetical protein